MSNKQQSEGRSEQELLPCPFCGSRNLNIEHDASIKTYSVDCENCLCMSAMFALKKEAIKAWNTRAGHNQKKVCVSDNQVNDRQSGLLLMDNNQGDEG